MKEFYYMNVRWPSVIVDDIVPTIGIEIGKGTISSTKEMCIEVGDEKKVFIITSLQFKEDLSPEELKQIGGIFYASCKRSIPDKFIKDINSIEIRENVEDKDMLCFSHESIFKAKKFTLDLYIIPNDMIRKYLEIA